MTVTQHLLCTERSSVTGGGSCGTERGCGIFSVRHSQVDGLGRGHCLLNPPHLSPTPGLWLSSCTAHEDTLEGLPCSFCFLFSLLSAGALATCPAACPRAWPLPTQVRREGMKSWGGWGAPSEPLLGIVLPSRVPFLLLLLHLLHPGDDYAGHRR